MCFISGPVICVIAFLLATASSCPTTSFATTTSERTCRFSPEMRGAPPGSGPGTCFCAGGNTCGVWPRRLGRTPLCVLLHFLRSSCSAQPCPIPCLPGVPEASLGACTQGGPYAFLDKDYGHLAVFLSFPCPSGAHCFCFNSGVKVEDRFHSLDPEPALREGARASGRGV